MKHLLSKWFLGRTCLSEVGNSLGLACLTNVQFVGFMLSWMAELQSQSEFRIVAVEPCHGVAPWDDIIMVDVQLCCSPYMPCQNLRIWGPTSILWGPLGPETRYWTRVWLQKNTYVYIYIYMPACSLAGVYFIGFVIFDNFLYFGCFGGLGGTQREREREREKEREDIEREERRGKRKKRRRNIRGRRKKRKRRKERKKNKLLKKVVLGEKEQNPLKLQGNRLCLSLGCHTPLLIQVVSVLLQSWLFFLFSFCLSSVFLLSWLKFLDSGFFCLDSVCLNSVLQRTDLAPLKQDQKVATQKRHPKNGLGSAVPVSQPKKFEPNLHHRFCGTGSLEV